MPVFFVLMLVGLVGLVSMALPWANRHAHHLGHAPVGHGGHGLLTGHGHAPHVHAPHAGSGNPQVGAATRLLTAFPPLRAIFSVLALTGAFGSLGVSILRLPEGLAAAVGIALAVVVERLVLTPIWNLLFRFAGQPSEPLESLLATEATAVTPFHNGRGMVSIIREGRAVQMRAELSEPHRAAPIAVGDALVIDDVDSATESVTVSPE